MRPQDAVGQPAVVSFAHSRLLAAVLGLEAWLVALIGLPAPLAARMFLAAPLVIVPALLGSLAPGTLPLAASRAVLLPWLALAAALPLLAAFSQPAGDLALLLSAPWIVLCAVLGLAALGHAVPRPAGLLAPARSAELATDAGLGLLAVGGLFLLAERGGLSLAGFGATTMLLGAVHYHFLGFGILGLVAWAAPGRPRVAWLAALGVVVGMPLAAAGMASQAQALNWFGALVIGLGGMAAVALLVDRARRRGPLPARLLLLGGALALLAGLAMGIGWSSSHFLGFAVVDFEAMVRLHGTLNAGGVILAALAGLAGHGREAAA